MAIPHALNCEFGSCSTARLVLAGRHVAFAVDPGADARRGQASPTVFVVSLSSGRILRQAPAAPATEPVTYDTCTDDQRAEGRCEPAPRVGPMFLSPRGAVAWAVQVTYVGSSAPPTRAVRKLDAGGATTLAAGAGIDVSSLAGRGSRVYWQDTDRPMTALLQEPS